MFIKAYVHNLERNEFVQISIDSCEICAIEGPVVFHNTTILQKEYIERNNVSNNIFDVDEITMHNVILKNGFECFVNQDELEYIGDGVYGIKEENNDN